MRELGRIEPRKLVVRPQTGAHDNHGLTVDACRLYFGHDITECTAHLLFIGPGGTLHDRNRRIRRIAARLELRYHGGAVRPAPRVMMTVWVTPGSVSSCRRLAAAAKHELTPGTTS